MRIALTNDDGIHAVGLRAIYHALLAAGHQVDVVAPMTEQSAVGHAITILGPLRVRRIKECDFNGFGVYGTPADCVKLGIGELLPHRPDLVVSGINAGANVGPDVLYSGTVAAATEAAHPHDAHGWPMRWEAIYAQAWAPEPGTPMRDGLGEIAQVPIARIPIRRRGASRD